MIPLRVVGRLALVVSALTLFAALPASAEPAAPVPSAAPTPAPAAAPTPAPAPADRPWLADSPAPQAGVTSSSEGTSWRSVLAALVLFAMGGGALYYQRRRRAQGPAAQLSVKVLGSAKVGPRAYAVVTSVGDHVLLLGVTDGSVRRLAWLAQPDASVAPAESPDEDEDDEAVGYVPAQGNLGNLSAAAFGRMLDQRLELHEREPTRSPVEPVLRNTGRQDAVQRPRDDSHLRLKPPMAQAAAKLEGKSKSFRDLVLKALDDKPGNTTAPKSTSAKRATQRLREAGGAAEAIANETRDVVRTTRSTRVEGQAAGLARLGGG